jgi:hypothetical protein
LPNIVKKEPVKTVVTKDFNHSVKQTLMMLVIGNFVDFDDIIDYAVMKHDIDPTENDTNVEEAAISDHTLLAYMSGPNGNNMSGDIYNVLAAKSSSIKGSPLKAI